ncbi:hypothetical protein BDR26DRAFT_327997 [Obelidium mucronatum]|nr:hypothetical protein BDR26DRAFT_327997 [Obelidium mucronatum]
MTVSGTSESKRLSSTSPSKLAFMSNPLNGLDFQIIAINTSKCNAVIRLEIYWWGTLGNFPRRCGLNIVAFTVGVAVVGFLWEFQTGSHGKAQANFLKQVLAFSFLLYNLLAIVSFKFSSDGLFPSFNSTHWTPVFFFISLFLYVLGFYLYYILRFVLFAVVLVSRFLVDVCLSPHTVERLQVNARITTTCLLLSTLPTCVFLTSPSLLSPLCFMALLFFKIVKSSGGGGSGGDAILPVVQQRTTPSSLATITTLVSSSRTLVDSTMILMILSSLFTTPHAIASLKDGLGGLPGAAGWNRRWGEGGRDQQRRLHLRGDTWSFLLDVVLLVWGLFLTWSDGGFLQQKWKPTVKQRLVGLVTMVIGVTIHVKVTNTVVGVFWGHFGITFSLVLCIVITIHKLCM